jgi:hypothetical protein
MKSNSLAQLKKELQTLPPAQLLDTVLRLGKFKKENKELLHYLLFEEADEENYIKNIKEEVSLDFNAINYSNVYYAKKSIRKILRSINKYIKYSGKPQTSIELLLHFIEEFQGMPIAVEKSLALANLYDAQIKKINKEISKLHEDLQYDYQKLIKASHFSSAN